MALPFQFPNVNGDTGVRVDTGIGPGPHGEPLRLSTCADRHVRLVPSDWPDGLARSVDARYHARKGLDKGRVLIVWRDDRSPIQPVAVCCWHIHEGNWPLAVFDAGWSNAVGPAI